MRRRRFNSVLLTILAAVIAVNFLLPVLWIVASAFTPRPLIFESINHPSPAMLLPQQPTLENFGLLTEFGFWRNLGNSLFIAIASVALGLVLTIFAAFALAVLRFPGRNALFMIVVMSFMIPFEAVAIPLSLSFREWGLGNTYIGLILPGLAHGMAVFNLRQFFLNVPYSLVEAASIDGAGPLRVLWRVYVPLSWPAIIGSGVLLFLGQWMAYLWPLLVANDRDLVVAPIALARVFADYNIDYGRLFAGALVLGVVPAILLLASQRVFVRSSKSAADK